ncbi:MAG TPA: type VI secretion system tube protein TssD [Candidatus Angelobacter sp.]
MHLMPRFRLVTSGAALSLALLASTAHAAVNAYIRIEGNKQGPFKGEGTRKGNNQWIPVVAVSHAIESPRDANTGLATGKRMHKPITITKEVDAASPQFFRALTDHEALREVVIEFVHAGPQGKEEVYQTVTLTDAVVSSIHKVTGAHPGRNTHELEEVSLVFQKIEVSNKAGKKTASDDWEDTK